MANNYINHVALVLDASSSMGPLTSTLIKVADEQIRYLAKRSQEMDQETRVSVYTFSYYNDINCLIFDKDALRLPSIAGLYRASGMTALIDASLKAVNDLEQTAQMYGDHAFLVYVLTDGMENNSRNTPSTLRSKFNRLPDNWTTAVLVPDKHGRRNALQCGFAEGNIEEWDASSAAGLEDSFVKIRQATDSYMTARASGVRGTKSLFAPGHSVVNHTNLKGAGLKPLNPHEYNLIEIDRDEEIRPFVERKKGSYTPGTAYYQLTKPEKVQPFKSIAIVSKKQGRVYHGPQARKILGLPDFEVRVKPSDNPEYDVFVQSTSVNRKLVPGTKLLVFA